MLNSVILSYLKKHLLLEKKALMILLGISLVSSSIVVLQPLMMQKIVDNAFILRDMMSLYFWATIIIILGIIGLILSSINQYFYTFVSTKILFNLRLDIFHLAFLKQKPFFQNYKTGDLLSRLQGDILHIQKFGTDSIFALSSALLGMIGSLVVMLSFDVALTLFALCLLPLEFITLRPLYPKMHQKTKELRVANASLSSFLIESLSNILFFKAFNYAKQRGLELLDIQEANRKKILSQTKLTIIFSQIPAIFALAGRTFLVFWGGAKVVGGQIQIGEFIAFLTYFGIILSPIQTLLGVLNNLPRVQASFDRLAIFIETPSAKKLPFKSKKPDIKFNNLSFGYPNSFELLQNINLHIPYGSKVVLLGENGSGKSTLFDLLLSFLKPTSGTITLDNQPIQSILDETLHESIGVVEQNPTILGMTLRENLLIGNKEASDTELLNALCQVQLSTWFDSLPYGLDTNLSENGLSLSSGQKQRVAIARVILKNPPIVLLDEHTSSLDENFLVSIEELIDGVFQHHTRVIISHNTHAKNAIFYKICNKNIIVVNP